MKRIVNKTLALLLAAALLTCAVPMMNVSAWNGGGIHNNGLGGIYIDIYKHPYTDSRWGNYGDPYGSQGCTWFVGARVMELTGKGSYNTQVGSTWYNSYGPNLGFTSDQNPSGGSVICWSGHVAILEKIKGTTAYISEGGVAGYTDASGNWHSCANNDYCKISTCNVSSIRGRNSGFIGYVHLGNVNQDPKGNLDFASGGEGTFTVRGWAFDPDVPNSSISVHIYIGGRAGQSGTECFAITADKLRADVNNVYGISGNHGFEVTLKTSKVGTFQVFGYAINNVYGSNNPELWDNGRSVTITKHTHSYKVSLSGSKNATCIKKGQVTYFCKCGESYTESTPIDPNNHVNTINVAATASTCTVKGYTAGVYCNDCKKYISGHQEQPLAEHQTTLINAKEATTTEEGYTGDIYCTVCKQTLSKGSIIPKLSDDGQEQNNEQTQQEKTGGCPWCGQTHRGVVIAFIVAMFHVMLAAIFGARY